MATEPESVAFAAITTDTGKSSSTQCLTAVTEHHIEHEWVRKANVLITRGMPERHMGLKVACRLKECAREFSIQGKFEI